MSATYGGATPAGRQAYSILDWAYEDPAGRAQEAIGRVREMATGLDQDALREVQGVMGMLTRLAGSVQYSPALANPVSISEQLDLENRKNASTGAPQGDEQPS
jgi:hypothetical protein